MRRSSVAHERFDCEVLQAHGADDALAALRDGTFDLVLVNRKLDMDYSDGIEVIRQIKADPDGRRHAGDADHQLPRAPGRGRGVGALRGFGKLEFEKPETHRAAQAVSAKRLKHRLASGLRSPPALRRPPVVGSTSQGLTLSACRATSQPSTICSLTGWTKCGLLPHLVSSAAFLSACLRSLNS